ncbi:MAG: alpha-1,4-glucan--maltose-1-phosphate maltosyltransferase [Betaproteobacteria bacterium SG8_41]|nr:MAG: alpha-1,4-glucan--maltose-1-phosphate maltosyltransferase [Betaproteobacteria bacterium SG8_41]
MSKKDVPGEGRCRAVIEGIYPAVDGGRFPAKRAAGDRLVVEADVFGDGHDTLRCMLRYRREEAAAWTEAEMRFEDNDRWRGEFEVGAPGRCRYTVTAWVDVFLTWRKDFAKRVEPSDVALALQSGAELVAQAAARAKGADARTLSGIADKLKGAGKLEARQELALGDELLTLMNRYPDRSFADTYSPELRLTVDPRRARCSAWYEMFPRSTADAPGRHGTFRDCEMRLPYVAELGFDVLYLPPIHPIGRVNRKGRNNALKATPDDPGSPWAIGSHEGGHKAVNPALGTLDDFRRLVSAARELGIEVALDIAFQCAPDHPYVQQHPQWFRWRPDGTVQYAENPPKKYEDIYPFNFECDDWPALWQELKSVFTFWVEHGVTIFRVDNPHTKPFAFWEWLIAEIQRDHPEAMFLSEAFTRPKVMHRLAKIGFTQSYTYFPWRNTKLELSDYFSELASHASREYFRPNHWPNTPDILTAYLQHGGRPAFMTRLVLAATLGANYGIYGPAFEHCENVPREPGSEEYRNSEKYEVRFWDLAKPDSLRTLVAAVNRARRENPALQQEWNIQFIPVDNDELICYTKYTNDRSNVVIMVVNLDPHHRQSGWLEVPLDQLGIDRERSYEVEDLLSGTSYLWQGARNYVELNPQACPAHVFKVIKRLRSERDFENFA